jgi:dihydrofolate reductase
VPRGRGALPRIALIVAVARNGVIGDANRLPWQLSEDLRRFRTLTSGHTVIMGRKTWQSIGKALPGRQNIVVTHQHDFVALDAQIAASLDEALTLAAKPEPVFVIGGETLYREALPMAHWLHITEIHRDFAGDTRFPSFARADWRETAREAHPAADSRGFDFAFVTYERNAGAV